jgi:hypothetical protein
MESVQECVLVLQGLSKTSVEGWTHKQAYQRKGQIELGVLMMISGLVHRSEFLVGLVVREPSNGRYEVSIHGSPNDIVTATPDKVDHIQATKQKSSFHHT